MLPDFLGIGVPRSGTTWLHKALSAHPDVWLPVRRKEVHYFDRYFDRGAAWYEPFFKGAKPGQRIGEITPHYLMDPRVPGRIRSLGSVRQLILILRNPVDRAVSHYRWRIRQDAYRGSFEDFLQDYSEAIAWGEYGRHIHRYTDWLERNRLMILIYERVFADPKGALESVGSFLDIDPAHFPEAFVTKRINAGSVPRFPVFSRAAIRTAAWLRQHDLDRVANLGVRLGLKSLVTAGDHAQARPKWATLERLHEHFDPDIATLERLTDLQLPEWRCQQTPSTSPELHRGR